LFDFVEYVKEKAEEHHKSIRFSKLSGFFISAFGDLLPLARKLFGNLYYDFCADQSELVSVITPVYNCEEYIAKTIGSVISQTYCNWEHILIDDASTDSSYEIIKESMRSDSRIKVIRMQSNAGTAAARNEGIKVAKGRYIAFLDSDDLWMKDKLIKQILFMRMNNYHFTYTQYSVMKDYKPGRSVRIPGHLDHRRLLLTGNPIGCLTVMLDKKAVDVRMPDVGHEDYAAWLDITKNGIKAYGLKESLSIYRRHQGRKSRNKLRCLIWTWNIYRKHLGLPALFSILCFLSYLIFTVLRKVFRPWR
jgi:teichuronic acid biosynthesis glycosyltransferase TuaG